MIPIQLAFQLRSALEVEGGGQGRCEWFRRRVAGKKISPASQRDVDIVEGTQPAALSTAKCSPRLSGVLRVFEILKLFFCVAGRSRRHVHDLLPFSTDSATVRELAFGARFVFQNFRPVFDDYGLLFLSPWLVGACHDSEVSGDVMDDMKEIYRFCSLT